MADPADPKSRSDEQSRAPANAGGNVFDPDNIGARADALNKARKNEDGHISGVADGSQERFRQDEKKRAEEKATFISQILNQIADIDAELKNLGKLLDDARKESLALDQKKLSLLLQKGRIEAKAHHLEGDKIPEAEKTQEIEQKKLQSTADRLLELDDQQTQLEKDLDAQKIIRVECTVGGHTEKHIVFSDKDGFYTFHDGEKIYLEDPAVIEEIKRKLEDNWHLGDKDLETCRKCLENKEEIRKLDKEYGKAIDRFTEAEKNLKKAQDELKKVKEDIDKIDEEIAKNEEELKANAEKREQIQEKIDDLKKQKEILEQELKNSGAKISGLEDEVAQANAVLAEKKSRHNHKDQEETVDVSHEESEIPAPAPDEALQNITDHKSEMVARIGPSISEADLKTLAREYGIPESHFEKLKQALVQIEPGLQIKADSPAISSGSRTSFAAMLDGQQKMSGCSMAFNRASTAIADSTPATPEPELQIPFRPAPGALTPAA